MEEMEQNTEGALETVARQGQWFNGAPSEEETPREDTSSARRISVCSELYDDEEEPQNIDWAGVCTKWVKETTMHGVRHTTKEYSPFLVQRLFWMVVTLVGTVILLYEISTRLVLYYSHPLDVDIQFNVRHKVHFPAITLCNINKYRTTGTAYTGFYNFWQEFWDPAFPFDINDYLEKFRDTDIEDMVSTWSHQKEDLIYSCSWHGGSDNCGPENFTTTFTDYGKCYTFNSDEKNQLWSTLTGSKYGLQLTLNVEQYEYTRGPENTAGIKMLIHPPDEIPRMRDLGSFIPVGFQALVGIEHSYRVSSPQPYGNCSTKSLHYYEKYTPASCAIDCFIEFVIKECGCRDVYMPATYPGYPAICDFRLWFTCARTAEEKYYNSKHYCDCPEACITNQYNAKFSYAVISKQNADIIAHANPVKAKLVKKSLEDAKNIYARQNKRVSKNDRKILVELLEQMVEVEYKILTMVIEIENIEKDAEELIQEVDTVANTYLTAMKNFSKFYTMDISVKTVEAEMFKIENCFTYFQTSMKFSFKVSYDFVNKYYEAYEAETDPIRKLQLGVVTQGSIDNFKVDVAKMKSSSQESVNAMTKLWNGVFVLLLEEFPLAKLPSIEPYNKVMFKLFQEADDCIRQVVDETRIFLELVLEENIVAGHTGLENITKAFDKLRLESTIQAYVCVKYARRLRSRFQTGYISSLLKTVKITPFETQMDLFTKAKINLLKPLRNLKRELHTALMDSRVIHHSMRDWFETFMMWRGTKVELANNMSTFRIAHFEEEIEILMATFTEGMEAITKSYNEFFRVVDSVFDIIKKDDFAREYFKLEVEARFDFQILDDIEEKMVLKGHDIQHRAHYWHDKLITAFSKSQTAFRKVVRSIYEFHADAQVNIRFYLDNFLQLNVFYTDFKDERIVQHPGYDFNSLIADIGGSIGLFVGASILTAVELFNVFVDLLLKKLFRPDLLPIKEDSNKLFVARRGHRNKRNRKIKQLNLFTIHAKILE